MMNYGIGKAVDLSYDEAIDAVTEELKKQGFGILTTIDVKDTLKKKIDKDFERYVILGACNPNFAYRALGAVPNLGLLLPCNVIVHETPQGQTIVEIFNPLFMAEIIDHPDIKEIARSVAGSLQTVLDALPAQA